MVIIIALISLGITIEIFSVHRLFLATLSRSILMAWASTAPAFFVFGPLFLDCADDFLIRHGVLRRHVIVYFGGLLLNRYSLGMLLGQLALFLDLFERLGSPPRLLDLHHLELFFAMIETIGTMVFLLNSF